MKTSELLLFYSVIKKQRQEEGYSCVAIKKRIGMIDLKLMKEEFIRKNKLKDYRNV